MQKRGNWISSRPNQNKLKRANQVIKGAARLVALSTEKLALQKQPSNQKWWNNKIKKGRCSSSIRQLSGDMLSSETTTAPDELLPEGSKVKTETVS